MNNIETLLTQFAQVAHQWFYDKPEERYQMVKGNYEFFKSFFTKENLSNATWEQFQQIGDNLYTMNSFPLAKGKAFGNPNHPIPYYREQFTKLLNPDIADDDKINNFKVSFFKNSLGELLGYLFPEKYSICNTRSEKALEFMGIFTNTKGTTAEKYNAFNTSLDPLRKKYTEIVGQKTDLPLNLELDQFLSWVVESQEKLNKTENIENILWEFIQRSRLCWKANLTNQIQLKGKYRNTQYIGKYGTTTPGNTTYLAFLNYEQEIRSGIYPVVLFNRTNQKLEVCYGISQKNTPTLLWNKNAIDQLPNSISERYSDSKVLQTFDIPEEENEIKQIIPSIIECLDKIIDDFHILFREHQNLTYWAVGSDWGRNQGDQQKRFLNNSIWEDGYGANGKEKYKKRLDSVKIGDIFVLKSSSTVGTGHKTPITIIKNIGIVQERKNFWSFKVKWLNIPTHSYKIEGKVLWATISEIEDQGILHMIKNLISGEENSMNSAAILTNFPLNQILFGPPGTGKTYHTILKAMEIINKKEYSEEEEKNNYQEIKTEFDVYKKKGQIKFITFHQNYSYEDFVGGIRPVLSGDKVSYHLYEGPFKEIAEKARQDKNNNYVLIIDEINRGNISKIFGELITLIEEDKREGKDHELSIPLMYHKEETPEFTVPANLYIIGTMNTADKSIAFVDFALRRRFVFEEIMPDPELLDTVFKKDEFSLKLKEWFRQTNEIIKKELDKDHQIGHSYFLKNGKCIANAEDFCTVLYYNILPLLQEYCYGEPDKLRKILPNFFDEQGILAIKPEQFIETLVQKNKNESSN